MRGFIEVTNTGKELVNISDISRVESDGYEVKYSMITFKNSTKKRYKETYEQIKQLIKEATL